jgi:hypothetical protein
MRVPARRRRATRLSADQGGGAPGCRFAVRPDPSRVCRPGRRDSINTAKTQMRQILWKTGHDRHVDLVRAIVADRCCDCRGEHRSVTAESGGGPAVIPPSPLIDQPTCKPGSVGRGFPRVTAIPLRRRLPGASSNLPGWLVRTDWDQSPCGDRSRATPIRFCSRWGLPCRSRCRQRGALLPHRFTLTRPPPPFFLPRKRRRGGGSRRSRSLWHFPWGHPRRTLSGTVCPRSPDFPPRRPFGPYRSGRPVD